jgi:hypothetical protein
VQIYSPRTQKVYKTIARFKATAKSGNIRHDGKLVAAGDANGLIQVSIEVLEHQSMALADGVHAVDLRH